MQNNCTKKAFSVALLLIVLWQSPSIFAHFLINLAHINYVKELRDGSDAIWNPNPYIELRDKYQEVSKIDNVWKGKVNYSVLTTMISQDVPSPAPSICPGSFQDHHFIRLLELIKTLQKAEEHNRVERLYEAMASMCSDSFVLYRSWAAYAEGQKLYDLAIDKLEKAVTLIPDMPPPGYRQADQKKSKWSRVILARAHTDIGVQYYNKYQYKKALTILKSSLAYYPSGTISPWLYYFIGVTAFNDNNYVDAKWGFENFLSIAPNVDSEAELYLERIKSMSSH